MAQTVVMILIFASSFFVWKWVKGFYSRNHGVLMSHLVAIFTSFFMFISSIILFIPKEFQRGSTEQVDLNPINFIIVFTILGIIYYFFKYKPQKEDLEL